MSNSSPASLHGHVASGLGGFSRLLPAEPVQPSYASLVKLAEAMKDKPDTVEDKPDPEENLCVPAGYTYLGQFVDHDLTFDTTSSLDPSDSTQFTNARTPSFDLDNVYGPGPDAAPYMYVNGIKLVEGRGDLPRQAGRAIIGDPRNDENSIVCNLQMAFLRFHNAVVDRLVKANPSLDGTKELFERARNEVRWTYQRILVEDFLPRIVSNETLKAFEFRRDPDAMGLSRNESAYALFTDAKRDAIPIEFAGAAYRFGHSMVRNGYRISSEFKAPIFALKPADDSLVGFEPLPARQVIDKWSRFFSDPQGPSKSATPGEKDEANAQGAQNGDPDRLQFAYRIDTTLVDPLANLPAAVAAGGLTSLAARNLLRGRKFQLPSGEAVSDALGVPVVDRKYLVVRTKDDKTGQQTFIPLSQVSDEFAQHTPLWFYLLAEAQQPVVDWWLSLEKGPGGAPATFTEDQLLDNAAATTTQLGEAGGRIVLEVFHGLLDADPRSYRNHPAAANWQPLIEQFRMWHLVNLVFKP